MVSEPSRHMTPQTVEEKMQVDESPIAKQDVKTKSVSVSGSQNVINRFVLYVYVVLILGLQNASWAHLVCRLTDTQLPS